MTVGAPTELSRFQDGFARALVAIEPPPGLPPQVAKVACQLAFSVYRNTVLKGWIDALEANFPSVLRLMGEEWFRAAAALHSRRCPPHTPVLALYGEDFADFLEGFEPAADYPYLGAIARLDRHWSEAHAAPDGRVLAAEAFAILAPDRLADAIAVLHPSARLAWFDHTAPTIWFEARGLAPESDELSFEAAGEGALIVRPHGPVLALKLAAGGHAFLDACARHRPLAEAAAAALSAEPAVDLTALTAELLGVGAFADLILPEPTH